MNFHNQADLAGRQSYQRDPRHQRGRPVQCAGAGADIDYARFLRAI